MESSVSFLIVDDDPLVRRALRVVLNKYGRCEEASSFASGRNMLQGRWSGLLFDVYLGDGSGLDLLRFARGAGTIVPAVLFSGRITPTMVNQTSLLGARLLAKPFSLEHLSTFLADVFQPMQSKARTARLTDQAQRRWSLSYRECELVRAAIDGRKRADVISRAQISVNTYKTQVRALLAKTGHATLSELAIALLNEAE